MLAWTAGRCRPLAMYDTTAVHRRVVVRGVPHETQRQPLPDNVAERTDSEKADNETVHRREVRSRTESIHIAARQRKRQRHHGVVGATQMSRPCCGRVGRTDVVGAPTSPQAAGVCHHRDRPCP